MIAKLKGLVDSVGADFAVIDVGGVGYLVSCSSRTLGSLPPVGEPASLAVETEIREDRIHLYGFSRSAERDCFRLLRSVQGVGVKVALAILSALTPDEIGRAIAAEDAKSLSRANGVGGKLAARIVNELKDKVPAMAGLAASGGPAFAKPAAKSGPQADAVSALVNLGYRQTDAWGAIAAALEKVGEKADTGALIREGLKELSR